MVSYPQSCEEMLKDKYFCKDQCTHAPFSSSSVYLMNALLVAVYVTRMTQKSGAGSNNHSRRVTGDRSEMWAEWGLSLMDPWISRRWSVFPEISRRFGSRATELGIWASAPFQGALSFFTKREGRLSMGRGGGELTGSLLFIARIRGHAALGAGMAPMPGLANQSQGGVSQGPAH